MRTLIATLSCLVITLTASQAAAAPLAFNVLINTTPLLGNAGAPFALDFQLNDGSGTVVNTATIFNFAFGGGAPTGSPMLFGDATGNLSSQVRLMDTTPFNEFLQSFVAGSFLRFDVLLTANVESGPIPDLFSISILDKNLNNIPTTGLGDSLALVNITRTSLGLSDVQTATSTSPAGVGATVQPVPEPASLLLLTSGVGAVMATVRKRRQAR